MALSVLVSGCGSTGDGGPDVVGDVSGGGGPRIATLGDSIVAGSPRWDPDPSVRASFTRPSRRSQWQHWVDTRATLVNCGVWGERTDEIATRYDRCVDGAEAVVVQGGINDIAQGRDVEAAARDLACMAERARADGLRIALVEVLPWNRGHPDVDDEIRALNERIHDLATRGGVPVLEFHRVLEDPDRPGRMPDGLTSDGDHPNVEGYRVLGERAWREPRIASGSFADGCGEEPSDAP